MTSVIAAIARSTVARSIITLLLMTAVLVPLDWGLIADRLSNGRPEYALAALAVIVLALALGLWRWAVLMRTADLAVPVRQLYRIYAVTTFANSFLPTAVGGDVARPLLVSRGGAPLARAATTVVLDRAAALFGLLALAWAGAAVVGKTALEGAFLALVLVTVLVMAAGGIATALALGRIPRLRALVPDRARPVLAECRIVTERALRSPSTLALVAAISLVFQGLVTLQVVLLGEALRLDMSLGVAAVALALVTLAMLMPITIGGFGLRESAYVAVLATDGISHSDAVLISLLSVVVLLLATLPGALELVRGGFGPALGHTAEGSST